MCFVVQGQPWAVYGVKLQPHIEITAFRHDDVIKWNIFRVTGHLCGDSPVSGEFPEQRPVARSFDVFFDLRLNERFSKHSWGWWLETETSPLWRHSNGTMCFAV